MSREIHSHSCVSIPACPWEGGRKGGRRKREGKKGKGGKRKRGKGGKKGREGKGRKGEERKGGIPAGIPAYLRWDTRHWGKMPPKMAKKGNQIALMDLITIPIG